MELCSVSVFIFKKEEIVPEETRSGEYFVQYSDDAQQEIEKLPDALYDRIKEKIRTSAAINPYLRGEPQGGISDRVLIRDDGVSALVWLSKDLRIMTVVKVQQEVVVPNESIHHMVPSEESPNKLGST